MGPLLGIPLNPCGPGKHGCDGALGYSAHKVAGTTFQNLPGMDLPYFLCAPLLVSLAAVLQQEEGSRKHAKHLNFGSQATWAPFLALPLTELCDPEQVT